MGNRLSQKQLWRLIVFHATFCVMRRSILLHRNSELFALWSRIWFSMKNVLFGWVLVSLSLLGACTSAHGQCYQMNSKDYFSIRSKQEMGSRLQKDLETMHAQLGKVDFDCLMREFDALGKRTTVELIRGGGFDGAHIFRFTVDNRINAPWTYLLSAPGASNGIFTAIVNLTEDGRIAIVERGGRLRWLTIRQKTK
jgi:hypothetical protein